MPKIKLDIIYTNEATICFGNKISLNLFGIIQVYTFVGTINSYIMKTIIPILLCLKDMDILSIYLNNIIN